MVRVELHARLASAAVRPGAGWQLVLVLVASEAEAGEDRRPVSNGDRFGISKADGAAVREAASGSEDGEQVLVVEYVACRVGGGWLADREWLVPAAHPSTDRRGEPEADAQARTPATTPSQSPRASESSGDASGALLVAVPSRSSRGNTALWAGAEGVDGASLPAEESGRARTPLATASSSTALAPAWVRALWDGMAAAGIPVQEQDDEAWVAVGSSRRTGYEGVLFASPATLVTEPCRLRPGEVRAFCVQGQLPHDIPPSFSGRAMRYRYAVGVAAQLRGGVPVMLRLPLRVVGNEGARASPVASPANLMPKAETAEPMAVPLLHLPAPAVAASTDSRHLGGRKSGDVSLRLSVRPVRLEVSPQLDTILSLTPNGRLTAYPNMNRRDAMSAPSAINAVDSRVVPMSDAVLPVAAHAEDVPRHHPVTFRVRCEDNAHLAHVTLMRTAYRPAEVVCALVDLRNAAVPCDHVWAFLETEECIRPERLSEAARTRLQPDKRVAAAAFRTEYAHACPSTHCADRLRLALPLPPDAPPSFSTDVVGLQWVLRLVFGVRDGKQHDRRQREPHTTNNAAPIDPSELTLLPMRCPLFVHCTDDIVEPHSRSVTLMH
ncbi:hypothetical protein CDCA_CDCA13G3737 [Cyanidium caldarium]|uniref:Uncharacterized protein n=1 Tax=Cyanidium caldarium TaxID=2771 RepID=A0AAV9IZH5_CYACA|nr:hypothetical protein CDCA_CDCA13G3737 [Cyanidium caldarium]|eukprot:ctg_2340.g506